MIENGKTPTPRRAKRALWKTAATTVVLSGVLTAAFIIAHDWKWSLQVEQIIVEGSGIVPAQEIVKVSRVTAGSSLYGTDIKEVKKNILAHPYIRHVEVHRNPPNQLRFEVAERFPVAAIVEKRMMYLDEEGVLVPPRQPAAIFDVPIVSGIGGTMELSPGSPIADERVMAAVSLLKEVRRMDPELYHLISEVHCDSSGMMTLFSADAGVPILVGSSPDIVRLQLLQQFWHEVVLQRGVESLMLVDLRFEGQIVTRWASPRVNAKSPPRTRIL